MKSTKKRIVETAVNLLCEKGYKGFSMRKVAEETSISLGNLQYYFKTKNDLLKEILQVFHAEYEKELQKIIHSWGEQGIETLRQVLKAVLTEEPDAREAGMEKVFFAMKEQGGKSQEILDHHYRELYRTLFMFLLQVCDGSDEKRAHKATSFLFPYFVGLDEVSGYLKTPTDEICDSLTCYIWSVLSGK